MSPGSVVADFVQDFADLLEPGKRQLHHEEILHQLDRHFVDRGDEEDRLLPCAKTGDQVAELTDDGGVLEMRMQVFQQEDVVLGIVAAARNSIGSVESPLSGGSRRPWPTR